MSQSFQKNIEDFVCEKCGVEVKGDGYTNHCPSCLWSKHVDVDPGDRASDCGGLMEPIDIEIRSGETIILHKCEKCGHQKKNKVSQGDNDDKIIELSKKNSLDA